MANIDTDFSAKEPSLGYFYQIIYALLLLFRTSKELEEPVLRIECLDDIDISTVNSVNLYQTKLHIKNKANLTDSSTDFWKTIRIWSEHISKNLVDIEKTVFNLVTTENVPESSILNNLKDNNLSDIKIEEIVKSLDLVSISSNNRANEKAYEAYNKLSQDLKRKLIKNVKIIDNSVDISDVESKIKKEIAIFIYPEYIDDFYQNLIGWWFKNSIENLLNIKESIMFRELQIQINNIRDKYSADNLPNHFPQQLEVTDELANSLQDKIFIKQLDLIELNIGSKIVKRAISDFRRAFEQRSQWLRLQLLNPDEEEEYDKRLEDYWRNIFDIMCDEGGSVGVDDLKKLGKDFYLEQFAKKSPQIKIRDKFDEDYLTRGSYHILSDAKKIGWHPNFNTEI